jgi:hypothetical protein
VLLLAIGFGLFVVGSAIVGATQGGHQVTVQQEVASDDVAKLPDSIEAPGHVDVTVKIDDASPKQVLLAGARSLLNVVLLGAMLWMVRGLLRSVRAGDAFTPANVRRLRSIGFALVFGVPAVALMSIGLERALMETTAGFPALDLGGAGFSFPGTALLAGGGVFVLAEVFAHGVRLRDDVEGTV